MFSHLNPPAIDVVESNKERLLIEQLRLPEALGLRDYFNGLGQGDLYVLHYRPARVADGSLS